MKAYLVILIFNFFSPQQSDEITYQDLIGKWKIVNARITNPIYCGPWDSGPIVESTMEFTNDRMLIVTSKDGIDWTNRTKPILWTFEDGKLSLRFDKTEKRQISAITKTGNTYFFRFTNMVEIGMEKE